MVGIVFPYIAFVVFISGIFYRLTGWKQAPQPGKLTLYSPSGRPSASMLKETLFFPSLYRADRLFWVLAWSFHLALALAFFGHFRAITGLVDAGLLKLGFGASGIEMLSAAGGGIAGVALIVSIGALLIRRVAVTRVREISSLPDFFALFLLIAVIATGNYMRFHVSNIDLSETRAWAWSLISFSPKAPLHPSILVHALFAEMLILYISFSKLMHFGGFFFTFPIVKRG
jgi:nitrate reductase gamma subunit